MSFRKYEYSYESVDETTYKYVRPRSPSPVSVLVPISTTTLIRTPSVHSIVTYKAPPSPRSCRSASLRRNDSVINVRFENDHDNTQVTTSVVTKQNSPVKYEYDYKYETTETVETTRRPLTRSKSFSSTTRRTTTTTYPAPTTSTITYDYKTTTNSSSSNNDNQVTTIVSKVESEPPKQVSVTTTSTSLLPVSRSVELGTVFDGNSFGLLSQHLAIKDNFDVSFKFRTSSKNGVLMMVVDSYSNDSFFIELCDSQLKATLLVDGEPDSCWTDFHLPVLSNHVWVNVNVHLVGNRLTMTVQNEFFTKHHRRLLRLPIRGDLYVAGFPSTIVPPYFCRARDFFIGEMKDFYVNFDGIKWYGTPTLFPLRLRYW